MRAAGHIVAIVGLVALSAGIVAGGRVLSAGTALDEPIDLELDDIPLDAVDDGADAESMLVPDAELMVASITAVSVAKPTPPAASASAGWPLLLAETHSTTTAPRAVAPTIIAPPDVDLNELERIEPREPLSEIGLAAPPKPKAAKAWDGEALHRPVATESARFEAMGFTIAISGAQSVAPDETCDYQGTTWNCGANARTAFRSFLRGRSPSCEVPAEPGEADGAIVATCRLGKQDIGAWLVENGWARAIAGGPYAEAAAIAAEKKRGVFGAPPKALSASGSGPVGIVPGNIVMPLDPTQTPDDGVPTEPLPWE